MQHGFNFTVVYRRLTIVTVPGAVQSVA